MRAQIARVMRGFRQEVRLEKLSSPEGASA